MIGPNISADGRRALRLHEKQQRPECATVGGHDIVLQPGVTIESPSSADSTEIAGVITPSP